MDLCLKEIIHNFTTNELLFYLDNLYLHDHYATGTNFSIGVIFVQK